MRNDKVRIEIEIDGQASIKELNLLQSQSNILQGELKKLKKGSEEYANTYKNLEQVNAKIKAHQNEIGLSSLTIAQLIQQKNKLYSEIRKNLIPGTEEYIKKTAELKKVQDRLKELSTGVQEVETTWQKLRKNFVFNVDVISMISGTTQKMGELRQEIEKVARETINLRNQIETLMNLQGTQLDDMTAKVQGLANKYGKDYQEVIASTNALTQAFGLTQAQSFELIEKGFIKGADATGQFLDKVKEYPVQFKNAGMSAEDFLKIATQEVKAGIYSDKFVDSVKEFGLRIRELGKAQQDALANAFGQKFADDFVKKMKSNALTTVDALALIDAETKKVNLSTSQMQTLIADLTGGAGEDMGGLSVMFENLAKAQKINLEATTDLEKEQKRLLETQKRLSQSNVALAKEFAPLLKTIDQTATSIKIGFVEGLTNAIKTGKDLIGFLQQNRAALIPLIVALTAYNAQLILTRTLSIAAAAAIGVKRMAMALLNAIMAANPIGFIITLIASLTSGVIYAYQNLEGFRAVILGVWNVLKNVGAIFKAVVDDIANFNLSMSSAGKTIAKSFNEGYNQEMQKGIDERKKKDAEEKKRKDEESKKVRAEGEAAMEEHNKKMQEQQQKRTQIDLEQIEKQKEFLEALKAYQEAKQAIENKITDIKIANIRQEFDRERAMTQEEYKRKLAEAKKEHDEMRKMKVANQYEISQLENKTKLALKEEFDRKMREIELKEIADKEQKAREQLENEKKVWQEYDEGQKEFLDIMSENENNAYLQKQAEIQARYGAEQQENAVRLEELLKLESEKQLKMLDLTRAYLSQKLVDMQALGMAETLEYKKISNEILQIDITKNDTIVQNEKRTQDLKKTLRNTESQLFQDFINLTGEFLSQDEQQRQKYAGFLKVMTIANIGIGLQREIQGIWENANKNPINALIPGFGTAFAGVQTGFAVARAGIAVNKVNAFEKGGILKNTGVLSGASHREGGLSVWDNRTGRQVAEFEGGEGVIFSKRTIQNNPHLWGRLLYSSQHLNGAKVEEYADGGAMNVRIPQAERNVSTSQNQQNERLVNKIDELINVIYANAESYKVVKAYVDVFELESKMAQNNEARRQNSSF